MFSLCLEGHAIFKLTYLSNHDYKPLYFESDAATVNEIVLKVSSAALPALLTASFHIFYAYLDNIYTMLICCHSLWGQCSLENPLHLNNNSISKEITMNITNSRVIYICLLLCL